MTSKPTSAPSLDCLQEDVDHSTEDGQMTAVTNLIAETFPKRFSQLLGGGHPPKRPWFFNNAKQKETIWSKNM